MRKRTWRVPAAGRGNFPEGRELRSKSSLLRPCFPAKGKSQESLAVIHQKPIASATGWKDATSQKQNARRVAQACVCEEKWTYGFFGVAAGLALVVTVGEPVEAPSVLTWLTRPGLFSAATTSLVKS